VTAAAVLFDMDGLLVDTEPVWTVAEEELAAHYGGVWTAGTKALVAGTRLDVSVPLMLESFGVPATPEEVAAAGRFLLDRMVAAYRAAVPVMPGALDLLDAVRGRGVPTGLVSSSYRVLVDAVLSHVGGLRFDVTVAGDELTAGKPHPECYRTACARLGVAPATAVVLEDALSGVAAAEAAGCVVVAVPDVGPIEQTPWRPVRSSLAAIDPDWLLGLPAVLGAPAMPG
jgi:HAD superfamily hydrolase (TIGR01509 family)